MKKTIYYLIVGIVIIIVGGYFISRPKPPLINPQSTQEGLEVIKEEVVEESEIKKYTLEEIARHNRREDCWMVINGKVYDVTNFISQHPSPAILLGCGKDATTLFETRMTETGEKIGSGTSHSQRAKDLLQQFYIGELE